MSWLEDLPSFSVEEAAIVPLHARKPFLESKVRRNRGRFAEKPGGPTPTARPSRSPQLPTATRRAPAKGSTPTKKPSAKQPEKDAPVDVGADVNKAADLLAQGKAVQMDQPRSVSTLLTKLAEIVNDAKAQGKDAPNFNLCKITVPGTNLFCAESKGIPRIKMPQLSGKPTAGSKADALPKDEKGEVNLTALFRKSLEADGIKIANEKQKASYLRASQIELNGAKVAGMTQVLDSGKKLGGDPRLFVSHDDYIVDGHHRWAANVAHDAADGTLGDVEMDVARVDMDISQLLDYANRFAADFGIPQAAVGQMQTGEKKKR